MPFQNPPSMMMITELVWPMKMIAIPIRNHEKTESRSRENAFLAPLLSMGVKHSTCTSYFQQRKQLSSHLDAKQDAATSLCNQEHYCYSHPLHQHSLILLLHHFKICFYYFVANFLKWEKWENETDLYLSYRLVWVALLELGHVSCDKP